MTTKEAFLQLVSKKKWYADLPITESAAWALAKRVRDGELISQEKMEAVLAMAGYQVVSEKVWAEKGAKVQVVEKPQTRDVQNEYLKAKAMQEHYEHTFSYMKKYYSARDIFYKSGVSYSELLQVKQDYEKEFQTKLLNLVNKQLKDREYGEPIDWMSALDYLNLTFKSEAIFKKRLAEGKIEVQNMIELIDFLKANYFFDEE